MPGFLLHEGALVQCMHPGGLAKPMTLNPRVKVSGKATVIQTVAYTITGCTHPPPTTGNGPCATALWTSAATRIRSGGMPLLLKDSQAKCAPTGTGLKVIATQSRVRGI